MLRWAAVAVLLLATVAPAGAQTVNRRDVPPGEAAPTGGTFSIRFPVAYRDVTVGAPGAGGDAAVALRMLTGNSADGIRFSATETPFLPDKKPEPMDAFMAATGKRAGATVSDVDRAAKDGMEALSFTLAEASGGTFFRIVRSKTAQYMQVIQFPLARRDEAAALKDDFFASFKVTAPR